MSIIEKIETEKQTKKEKPVKPVKATKPECPLADKAINDECGYTLQGLRRLSPDNLKHIVITKYKEAITSVETCLLKHLATGAALKVAKERCATKEDERQWKVVYEKDFGLSQTHADNLIRVYDNWDSRIAPMLKTDPHLSLTRAIQSLPKRGTRTAKDGEGKPMAVWKKAAMTFLDQSATDFEKDWKAAGHKLDPVIVLSFVKHFICKE